MGVLAGTSLLVLGWVKSVPAYGAPQDKVTICHATNSVENPYDQITVNANSIVKPDGGPTGHATHTGPVYPTPDWGDIIPSFQYNNDHGGVSTYPGLNWSGDGQAIWNGGCLVVFVPIQPPEESTTTTTTVPPTTVPPTTVPPTTSVPTTAPPTPTEPTTSPTTTIPPLLPTTTTTAPSTTTTAPPPGATTTVPPGGSTTTPPGGGGGSTTTRPGGGSTTTVPALPSTPPTTAPSSVQPPPLVDPPNGVEIVPPVESETIDPGPKIVTLGPLSPSQRMTLEDELDVSAPAPTGAPPAGLGGASTSNGISVGWVVAGGILVLVAALATLALWRYRRRA